MNAMRRLALASAVTLAVFGSDVLAQQKGGNLKRQIEGSWSLVSQYVQQGDKKVNGFGPTPKGLATFGRDGRFSMMLFSAGLPRIAGNNRMQGTPEENKAIVQGSIAYYGTYQVNETDKSVEMKIEGSTFPNYEGQPQKRPIVIKGDEMTMSNPTPALGAGIANLVWKRAK